MDKGSFDVDLIIFDKTQCNGYNYAILKGKIRDILAVYGGKFSSVQGKDAQFAIRKHLGSYFGLHTKPKTK